MSERQASPYSIKERLGLTPQESHELDEISGDGSKRKGKARDDQIRIGTANRMLSAVSEDRGEAEYDRYVKTWKSNFVLTLDGGGVRGYSQLIILKRLMDKVERIERSKPVGENNVDSSYYPIPWSEVPTSPAAEQRERERSNTKDNITNANGNANGKMKDRKKAGKAEELATEHSRFYPHHYFDWIAGTSTGGLNAIMLSRLRMSVDECLEGYSSLAKQIFGSPRLGSYRFSPFFWPCAKYSKKNLQKVVKDIVQSRLQEREADCFAMNPQMCRTVVVAIKSTPNGHQLPHLFKTYAHHEPSRNTAYCDGSRDQNPIEQCGKGPADTSLIWQVARATTAAPSYFSSIKIGQDEYIDGGFGVNNPSSEIFFEVSQMNHDRHEANELSVSIGTGISRFKLNPDGLLNKPIGWLNGAKKISTDCEKDYRLMLRITKGRYKFFRFNVPENRTDPEAQSLPMTQRIGKYFQSLIGKDLEPLDRGLGSIKTDEWKEKSIWRKESTKDEIERVTLAYLGDTRIDEDLETIAQLMVDHRRRRAEDTPRWEAYALGIRYSCNLEGVGCPDEIYRDRAALRQHLVEYHRFGMKPGETDERLEELLKKGRHYAYHH